MYGRKVKLHVKQNLSDKKTMSKTAELGKILRSAIYCCVFFSQMYFQIFGALSLDFVVFSITGLMVQLKNSSLRL